MVESKIYNIYTKIPVDKERPDKCNPKYKYPYPQDNISSMSPSLDVKDTKRGTVLSREYYKDGTPIVRFEWSDILDDKGRLVAIKENTIYGITSYEDGKWIESWDLEVNENIKIYKKGDDWSESINEIEKRRKTIYIHIESQVKKIQFKDFYVGEIIHKRLFDKYKEHLDKWLKQGWVNGLFTTMEKDIDLLINTFPNGGIEGEFTGTSPEEIVKDLIVKSFTEDPSDTVLQHCVAGYLLSPSETLLDELKPELGYVNVLEYLKLHFFDYYIHQD